MPDNSEKRFKDQTLLKVQTEGKHFVIGPGLSLRYYYWSEQ